MAGHYCDLYPLNLEQHSEQLFAANRLDSEDRIWVYMGYGPFDNLDAYREWVRISTSENDPQFFAVVPKDSGLACGVASYLRIEPAFGNIEVGHINFATPLQQSIAATECMYLMMRRVFDELHYRRYEWKCDALNARSRSAAERLGFTFEGVFRQAMFYKGRNRDTAWYSITDKEWPAVREAFEQWLDPDNFDGDGRQKQSLRELMPPPS